MSNLFIGLGSLGAFIGVATGAFGAHGLKNLLDASRLATWDTAVTYLFVHALGLLLIGILESSMPRTLHLYAGWTMLAGILLFSGSLFLLSLTGIKWLGAITPVGGLCFLAAWLMLAWSYLGPHSPTGS